MNEEENNNKFSAELMLTLASAGLIYGTREAVEMCAESPGISFTNIYIFLACSIGFAVVLPVIMILFWYFVTTIAGDNTLFGLILIFIFCTIYFLLSI